MAYEDNELGTLAEHLSPIMSSGADWEAVLASGDPAKYLASMKTGSPSGSAALQQGDYLPGAPPSRLVAPSLLPQNGSHVPFADPKGAPAVTAAPSAFSRPDPNAIESQLVQASTPQSPTNPIGVPNPKSPEYRPSAGRRIARGALAAVQGLAEGGIRGAVLGAVNPEAVGATPYGAGNSRFSTAARANQMQQQSLQQQLSQANSGAKAEELAARAAKESAQGESYQTNAGAKAEELTARAAKESAQGESYQPITLSDEEAAAIGQPDLSGKQMSKKAYAAMLTGKQKGDSAAKLQQDKYAAINDPNSPSYKLATRRSLSEETRANAYALNANAANLGVDNQGRQIEGGVTSIDSKPIGSRFAPTYVKQEGKVAQFNDVGGALDNLEKSARAMVAEGEEPDSALIAGALAQPKGTAGKWIQSQIATGNLSPEQRDYVTNLIAAHENIQALRQSAGGGVSDSQVNRLIEMLPNASTPDLDYFLRQTRQIRQTANRLSEGVPQTKGGHAVKSDTPASGGIPPKSIIDSANVGQYLHGPGGVSYQKRADGLYDSSGKKVQ